MSIQYKHDEMKLADVIKAATKNATLVVPDLQRPYVWSPKQVTLLVDSLFKGWPFGSLLLWEVEPDCYGPGEGIPHRPFWHAVNRTDESVGAPASTMGAPATYRMVLDGQQRVQSLILALGGDTWGFTLYDHEWAWDQEDRRIRRNKNHVSTAYLYIDLENFASEVQKHDGRVRMVKVESIMRWVTPQMGPRPANYLPPLPSLQSSPGRFIRLSRLWEMAVQGLSADEYSEQVSGLLEQHKVVDPERFLKPLCQFMTVVERVKTSSVVHSLQIGSFKVTPLWTKDDYNDAIVNIFTRLNTAGRTLTREEITLAWLKVGWEAEHTDGKSAGTCLEELRSSLLKSGFDVDMDGVVRLLAYIWAVDEREGEVLQSKDLLQGDKLRPMARYVATQWRTLTERIHDGVMLVGERQLGKLQWSFNSMIVYLTWYWRVSQTVEEQRQRVTDKDALLKTTRELAGVFLDRWLFGSQWAGVWGYGAATNFADFARILTGLKADMSKARADNVVSLAAAGAEKMMDRINRIAVPSVQSYLVHDRSLVHQYHTYLWIWHRLDKQRWEMSDWQMLTGRSRHADEEVDHAIAVAMWDRLIDLEVERKTQREGPPAAGAPPHAPDGFASIGEAKEFINRLGNTSLLRKTFNVSKSAKAMWEFLSEVHEFKTGQYTRTAFEAALKLNAMMTDPAQADLASLRRTIEERDRAMKNEIVQFLNGGRRRADL